jgi:hypothetical protein
MIQIDPIQFLIQVAGLGAWICLAAAIYALVENMVGGPAAPDEPTKM